MSFIELLVALTMSTLAIVMVLGEFVHREHLFQQMLLRDASHRLTNNRHEYFSVKQYGVSLIEIMLILAIASYVSLGLMRIYLISQAQQKSMTTQCAEAFDLAWAEQLIRDRIRHAGFTPCLSVHHLNPNIPAYRIEAKPEHALHLYRMDDAFFSVLSTDPNHIQLEEKHAFHEGAVYLLSDCYHAEFIHPVRSINTTWELADRLNFEYTPPIYVGLWLHESFILHGSKLMYAYAHPECLIDAVRHFSIALLGAEFRIDLSMLSGKNLSIETSMRNI